MRRLKRLKLAHGLKTKHPVHRTLEWMARRAAALSNNQMRVDIFPEEQLGNENECIQALQKGYLAMTKTSTGPVEALVPRIRIFGIPYLFRSEQHFWTVIQGPIGKELLLAPESEGLRGLCYYGAGARSFYGKKSITRPSDLKKKKVRVNNSMIAMEMITTLGGSPTSTAWGKLYTSLDQRLVDVAENNLSSFYTSRHYEICKYFSLDEHMRLPDMVIISAKVWADLSEQQQQWLQQAADESVVHGRKLWDEEEKKSLDMVKKAGIKVIRPEKKPFLEAVKPLWNKFLSARDEDDMAVGQLLRQIQEADNN